MKLSCPACGAEIQLKSRVSVFGVCTFCDSMVVRRDMDLEALGKMAELPPDMSPLQVSTRGRYKSRSFEIVGRLKIGWKEGTWNEWYLLFDDGRDGWLAEAQGMFMLSFPFADVSQVMRREHLKAGGQVRVIAGEPLYEVDDIKEASCLGSEGELPMKAPKGRQSWSVDLSSADGSYACIDYAEDGVRLYAGKYVELGDLELTGLRELDGW
jgi:hypothetical protein